MGLYLLAHIMDLGFDQNKTKHNMPYVDLVKTL